MSLLTALSYGVGECTRWAAQTVNWIPSGLGNAGSWLLNAQNKGYPISSTPVVGSVAVWGYNKPGTLTINGVNNGHVAVVTGIQNNGLPVVSEMNATAGWNRVDTRAVDPNAGSGIIGYILPMGSGAGTTGTPTTILNGGTGGGPNNNGSLSADLAKVFTALGVTDANYAPSSFTAANGTTYQNAITAKDSSGNVNLYDRTGKFLTTIGSTGFDPTFGVAGAISNLAGGLGTSLSHFAIVVGLILLGLVFIGGGVAVFGIQSGAVKKIL